MTYRVQRSTSEGQVVFAVSGELDESHAAPLQVMLEREPAGRVVLDLADVTVVDRGAVRYLMRAESAGAALVNCPDYIRRWMTAERGLP